MKRANYEKYKKLAIEYFEKAKIVLTDEEKASIEVSDFGKDQLDDLGLQLVVYVNTERVCAKEMVLLPGQSCPEHKHIASYGREGKEETFRCRYGQVYLYVAGEDSAEGIKAKLPGCSKVTVFKENVLNPGEQYTIMPETWHWFQGGPEGAVISEFSTMSTDETDIFTDETLIRAPFIED